MTAAVKPFQSKRADFSNYDASNPVLKMALSDFFIRSHLLSLRRKGESWHCDVAE